MATSSFEKNFVINTDEGLANLIEVMKGNPPPLKLSKHPYNPSAAEAWVDRWISNQQSH